MFYNICYMKKMDIPRCAEHPNRMTTRSDFYGNAPPRGSILVVVSSKTSSGDI